MTKLDQVQQHLVMSLELLEEVVVVSLLRQVQLPELLL